MPYKMGMQDETKPKIKRLLPEGWNKAKITSMIESTSKAGNMMFVAELTFVEENGYAEDIYLVAEQGKRWMLKKLLTACAIPEVDGEFVWEIDDVLGKEVNVLVQQEPNTYFNRDGEKVETKQNRFNDFQEVAWDS